MTAPTPEQAPREALETVIRRQLANIAKRPHTANECTDAILAAADACAADEVTAALEIARRIPLETRFGHRFTALPDSGEVELQCSSHAPFPVTWKVGYHPSLDVLIKQAAEHNRAEHGGNPEQGADLDDLREQLAALAAKWDATPARNQRNGRRVLDQGDEYGSEGLAIAEALGACHAELTAIIGTT